MRTASSGGTRCKRGLCSYFSSHASIAPNTHSEASSPISLKPLPNRRAPRRGYRCRQYIVKTQYRAILGHAQRRTQQPAHHAQSRPIAKRKHRGDGRPEASLRRTHSSPPSKPEGGSTRLGS
jgi:hypothetical protein